MYSAKSSGNSILSNVENIFFLPPPFAREFTQALTVHCKVLTNFSFNFSIRSSNLTAPSCSRRIEESCRSDLVMNFDTAKQMWSNDCGSMSIHILLRIGTQVVDKFTTRFNLVLAFATGFPVLVNSWTFSMGISSAVSVTYLLIPFTMRTHETVWSSDNDSIMISTQ